MEHKKEEFRKYLDNAGVMEALTKVLVGLYEEPEKPKDAVDYLKNKIGTTFADAQAVESLRVNLEEAQQEIARLKEENTQLQLRITQLEQEGPAVDQVQVKHEPVEVQEELTEAQG